MRQKKHRKVARTVRFLKIAFKFREPFKVVLDGNFVHALMQTKTDPVEAVPRLLGGVCKLYTSHCILEELRGMGPAFVETLGTARRHMVLHCAHTGETVTAKECLTALVGENNPEHFFVATQDRGLRSAIDRVPGGASVFASVNGLHLQAPSEAQQSEAKAVETRHMAVTPQERESEALQAAAEDDKPKEKSIFKRRKAKGPNPLSLKSSKKKTKQRQNVPALTGEVGGAAPDGKSKSRARRKRTKEEPGGETDVVSV